MSVEINVPILGESISEATVLNWLKKDGDSVVADEILCELETDKITVEVYAPASGVLTEIAAEKGTTVVPGALLARVKEGEGSAKNLPKKASEKIKVERTSDAGEQKTAKDIEDAPSARRLMSEAGIDPSQVAPSGKAGRIMKEDVLRFQNTQEPAPAPVSAPAPELVAPTASPAKDVAGEERVKMSRLRQTIAKRLKESQNTAAILTTYNEVDMSAIIDLRTQYKDIFQKKHGVKLGFMSFFVKACILALKEVPAVNAEIDGDEIIYKNYVHMGVAVGTPMGLVVPILRNADQMGFAEIEKNIAALGQRASEGKLSVSEMQGGSFTISNGGVYGSLLSSPILNPPQSGILGMHKIEERPIAISGSVEIRPMMYVALSYDHRIIDGKEAVTFLVRVKEVLETPARLLMGL